jgi:hypothetical protein
VANHLQAQCGDNFAIDAFGHLEFLKALFQVTDIEVFFAPKGGKFRKIVNGRAADLQWRRAHWPLIIVSAAVA